MPKRKNLFWKKVREKDKPTEEAKLEVEKETALSEKGIFHSPQGETYFGYAKTIYVINTQKFWDIRRKLESAHPEWSELPEDVKLQRIFASLTWYSKVEERIPEPEEMKMVEEYIYGLGTRVRIEKPLDWHEKGETKWSMPFGTHLREGENPYPKPKRSKLTQIKSETKDRIDKIAEEVLKKLRRR